MKKVIKIKVNDITITAVIECDILRKKCCVVVFMILIGVVSSDIVNNSKLKYSVFTKRQQNAKFMEALRLRPDVHRDFAQRIIYLVAEGNRSITLIFYSSTYFPLATSRIICP